MNGNSGELVDVCKEKYVTVKYVKYMVYDICVKDLMLVTL